MDAVALENRYSARNYRPLPVTLARGEGAYLWDTDGRRYIDMMSAYSAVSHGHGHPRILAALGNFHGRTTTIIGFSSEPDYRDGFGPFAPGFRAVPFGDLSAMESAIM